MNAWFCVCTTIYQMFVYAYCLATRLSDGGNHRGHLQQLVIKGYFWHKNK